jgi:integrase
LDADGDRTMADLLNPKRNAAGAFRSPYRFSDANPWHPNTQLRNWIAYRLARELGLRRGEIGKIRVDDVREVAGVRTVTVRRRPNDAADDRAGLNRLRVKTVERELSISAPLEAGIRQYIFTALSCGGRRGATTPYLLVTESGMPISGTSLDKVWTAIKRQLRLPRMSWHVLRTAFSTNTSARRM